MVIVFAIDGKVACVRSTGVSWEFEAIEGEDWLSTMDIASILDSLHPRLQDKEIAFEDVDLQLVYNPVSMDGVSKAIQKLLHLGCETFQVLRWDAIVQRAQASSGKTVERSDDEAMLTLVCPMIESTVQYKNEAIDAERQRAVLDHETSMETLRQESLRLLAEKADLQAQVNALKLPEMDLLVSFLPAIYENFFLTVSPQDLALMAGTINLPKVHSTFTEPDFNTINALKKRLQNMPPASRAQVIDFAKNIPHKLTVRKEMQSFMEDE
jgi:hypothetical protein